MDENLWFHVDAAWGGAAIVSPQLKQHLAGIETADSITCDAHKWFSVPMGCGMFFCRHPERVAEAFRCRHYLLAEEYGFDGSRPAHDFGAMVPPVYRPEAFYGACATRRIGTDRNDRTTGPYGSCPKRSSDRLRLAYRQFNAAAPRLLHSGGPCSVGFSGRSSGTSDCVDVGSGDRRRSGPAGMHHQFQDNRSRYSLGGRRDEPSLLSTCRTIRTKSIRAGSDRDRTCAVHGQINQ